MREHEKEKRSPYYKVLDVDFLLTQIINQLEPNDIVLSLSPSSRFLEERFVASKIAIDFWRNALVRDFCYRDRQENRLPRFYKNQYLGILEENLARDHLISGGH